jgi:hypothetical protein
MNEKKVRATEEWWTEDQKAIVEDVSFVWIRKTFEKSAGFWTPINGGRLLSKLSKDEEIPEGAVVDNTAWDHEHCELCWQTISEFPTHQQEGYTDGKNWLCLECYSKYIGVVSEG